MSSRFSQLRYFAIIIGVGLLLLVVRPAAAAVQYAITDLGPITAGGTVSDINDSGQVVGITNGQNFLYTGSFPLVVLGSSGSGAHVGINNSGLIVGHDASTNHATLYSGGAMTNLGTLGGSYC